MEKSRPNDKQPPGETEIFEPCPILILPPPKTNVLLFSIILLLRYLSKIPTYPKPIFTIPVFTLPQSKTIFPFNDAKITLCDIKIGSFIACKKGKHLKLK